jgi:polygalacturonase
MKFLIFLLFPTTLLLGQGVALDVRDFGAIGDGLTMCTTAIQKAVDSCAALGGGRVTLPAGTYLSGSVRLRSRVELYLAESAILLGSTRFEDYGKNNWYALVLAFGERDIAVRGTGSIDGQGTALAQDVDRLYKEGKLNGPYWDNRPHEQHRPQLIDFESCVGVLVEGVTLRNSSCWVQRYGRCEDLVLQKIRVESMAFWNNDGIDLVDCRRVLVQDCDINAADDGICLKSDRTALACEDILIRNCRIRSSASALKFGTNSYGGFRRIKVRGLRIRDTYRSAIALEIVDGGVMEDIDIRDVEAVNTGNAIFIRLGHRYQRFPPGKIRNIRIQDVQVQVPRGRPDKGYPLEGPAVKEPHNLMPSSVVGLPGHPIENVVLKNITIRHGGGGDPAVACVRPDEKAKVPERPKDYPEFSMFGELPAWGFYLRHVRGIRMKKVKLVLDAPDYRPAYIYDDVSKKR